MKDTLKVLMVLMVVGLFCLPVMAQTEIPVTNGDMEDWTVNGAGGPPDNWTNVTTLFSATQEGTTVHGGSYSVNLTWTSTDNQDFLSDFIPVTGDVVYTIHAWIYDNDPAGRLRLTVEWYDNTQTYINWNYGNTYSVDNTEWQQYDYEIAALSNAAYAKIKIRMYDVSADWDGDATCYLDDVTFTYIAGNQPPSIGTIYRYPYPTVFPTDVVVIEAPITDSDGTIAVDSMYYQTTGAILDYTPVYHDSIVGNNYYYQIPAQAAGTLVEYYVIAVDDGAERTESSVLSYTVSNPPNASLLNPGFEDWTVNGAGGPPDHWILDTSGQITATQEGTTVHSGSYSTNLTWTTQTQADCDFLSEPFTITAEESYVCSLYVYDNDIAGHITVYFAWNTGNNFPGINSINQEGWQVVTATATAPVGATSVQFGIRGYDDATDWDGDATVYVDDATFSVATEPPPVVSIYDAEYTEDQGVSPNCFPSPYLNTLIEVTGTVTGMNQGSYPDFYIQDCSDASWNGLYIYEYNHTLSIGDNVTVVGSIAEFHGLTEMSGVASIVTNSTGNAICTTTVTSDDLSPQCNFTAEAYENMLVKLDNVLCVIATTGGTAWVKSDGATDSCAIDDYMYAGGTDQPDNLIAGQRYNIVGQFSCYNTYMLYPRFASDVVLLAGESPLIANVHQYPPSAVGPADNVLVSAEITDDGTITDDALYLETIPADFNPVTKDSIAADGITYWYTIGTNAEGTTVNYYISATDNDANTTTTDTYTYTVQTLEVQTIAVTQFNDTDPGVDPDCYPSPFVSDTVSLSGIITAVKFNDPSYHRCYFQDADSLWSGINVFAPVFGNGDPYSPVIGDSIAVIAPITEYSAVTECNGPVVTLLGTGTVYEPLVVSSDDIPPACEVVGESYESMLVRLENALCVIGTAGGQAWFKTDGATDSCIVDDFIFGPPPFPTFIAGQRYNIVGIVSYFSGRFMIYPRSSDDVEFIHPPEPVIGPVVQDPPGTLIDPSANVVVSAGIVDYDGTIVSDNLYLETIPSDFNPIAHDSIGTDGITYWYTIGPSAEGTVVNYYISATDNDDNTTITQTYTYTATSYTPTCADDIADIQTTIDQGAWPDCFPSPSDGQAVDICGIITGAKLDSTGTDSEYKFFVQTEGGGGWSGIYVYDAVHIPTSTFSNGDKVELFGTVDEYNGLTELTSITEAHIISSGNPYPAEINVKIREFESDCSFATESYEDVLVKFKGVTILSASGSNWWITDTTSTDSIQLTNYLYYGYDGCLPNPPLATDAYYDSLAGCMYWYGSSSNPDGGYWRIYPRCGSDFYSAMEPIGACCVEGECVATNTEAECAVLGGNWFIGESCDNFQCPSEGYEYLPGDANMYNGSWPPNVIGSDVTYLVNFFRGLPTNPACNIDGNYMAADVNASCSIIGSDVTRLVNYFRGSGAIEYCPDWEPAWHNSGELPEDAPAGWPNCDAPIVNTRTLNPQTGSTK